MIYYICDGCGVRLKEESERFIISIDATRADDSSNEFGYDDYLSPEDNDGFWGLDDDEDNDDGPANSWRFDLCPKCYALYVSDPLAIITLKRGHSRN